MTVSWRLSDGDCFHVSHRVPSHRSSGVLVPQCKGSRLVARGACTRSGACTAYGHGLSLGHCRAFENSPRAPKRHPFIDTLADGARPPASHTAASPWSKNLSRRPYTRASIGVSGTPRLANGMPRRATHSQTSSQTERSTLRSFMLLFRFSLNSREVLQVNALVPICGQLPDLPVGLGRRADAGSGHLGTQFHPRPFLYYNRVDKPACLRVARAQVHPPLSKRCKAPSFAIGQSLAPWIIRPRYGPQPDEQAACALLVEAPGGSTHGWRWRKSTYQQAL